MLDLAGWAALAEIVATVAVVLSLLLVAYSIKRNTDEMEQKETLTDVERFQYVAFQDRYLGLLEIAWTQYKSGRCRSTTVSVQ